jgi:hypothetical protein
MESLKAVYKSLILEKISVPTEISQHLCTFNHLQGVIESTRGVQKVAELSTAKIVNFLSQNKSTERIDHHYQKCVSGKDFLHKA